MDLRAAAALEQLINSYIARALSSPESLEEITAAFGGLDLESSAQGVFDRVQLAHAIASKVLRTGWYYEVVKSPDASVKVVITGAS